MRRNFLASKSYLVLSTMLLTLILLTACANTGDSASNEADNYPEREIEVYVGHGPGGGTDTFVRTITNQMSDIIDGEFNIINQEGGSGVVAMQNAMQQPADGYTLIGDSAYAVTTAAGTNEYGLDQVVPIARVQSDTYALQVKKGTFESIDELVSYAEANPGKIRIGAVGTMGIDEITARRFMKEAGVDMNYIPMEGAGEMHSGILGGHIDVMLEEVGPTMSYIEDEEFEPLVFFSEERIDDFSEVPTTVEKGWDLTDGVERYLMAPADTPQEIIDKLEDASKEAMETEEYQEYAENSYLDLRDGWMGSEDFKNKLEEDIKKYEEILAEIEE
ncbi:Tripartite-type tricarboxylate transporter, receptor component TctC [Lentibacillus halodurans]|uniref:Tripartite-type tricarboxylate transporter, receptor component TctC n=1 Tax=Lentibacillus halodurans TaxID=237679 RepID=A0A1I0XMD8_9BACI|nr:tripartite tricarboxylate transporter substrate binding protein [Lentibacillus halodurans]SFB01596.1 Tripartite-type tricarboxylate transporter, receptor component TctC [Lentibacillus halodurans]